MERRPSTASSSDKRPLSNQPKKGHSSSEGCLFLRGTAQEDSFHHFYLLADCNTLPKAPEEIWNIHGGKENSLPRSPIKLRKNQMKLRKNQMISPRTLPISSGGNQKYPARTLEFPPESIRRASSLWCVKPEGQASSLACLYLFEYLRGIKETRLY